MYPFGEGADYVRNAWYLAAWSQDLQDKPVARTIMDKPIVFFRNGNGEPRAMWGVCPHRYHPLVDGTVRGDTIMCPYHGFTYDGSGACVHVPAQSTAPDRFRLKTYPVAERHGGLWIWMGPVEIADPALIPALDTVGFGAKGWRGLPNGSTYLKARWSLLIDNLMDLSHVAFLHPTTIQQPDAAEVKPLFEGPPQYRCVRWLPGQNPDTPYYRKILPENTQPLDGELDSRFFSPAIIITSLIMHAVLDNGERRQLGTVHHLHGITPETKTTTHDFSGVTRNVQLENAELDEWQKAAAHAARVEDVEALEKVEPQVAKFGNPRTELVGPGDLAGLRVRRHLAQLMEKERATAGQGAESVS